MFKIYFFLKKLMSNPVTVAASIALLLLYITWGTGIHGDDYVLIALAQKMTFWEILSPQLSNIHVLAFGPGSYLLQFISFYNFGWEDLFGYDIVKFIVSGISIWFVYHFSSDYMSKDRAILVAVFFVLLITHDATLYWVGTLMYVLCPALIMYSHHLIRHKKNISGVVLSTLGAFTTYASPPYTFGLAMIFFYERAYKKAFLFMAPGFFYVMFYFAVSSSPDVTSGRINSNLSLMVFIKQYFLQVFSFIDAAFGPSFWLKLWYSMTAITLSSLVIASLSVLIVIKVFKWEKRPVSHSLIVGLLSVLLLAFAMFSLTGFYPQISFNLGNRVMVYGSLLLAFIYGLLPYGRNIYSVFAIILILSILGLSDHWKEWNKTQIEVIENIRNNKDLKLLGKNDLVLVSGHAFSKLGPFSHIEFFSETYMVGAIFRSAINNIQYELKPINSRSYIEGHELIDRKYGYRTSLVKNVVIYNAETNIVSKISIKELEAYIKELPYDTRHWFQLLGDDSWIKSMILILMPRLQYLFK